MKQNAIVKQEGSFYRPYNITINNKLVEINAIRLFNKNKQFLITQGWLNSCKIENNNNRQEVTAGLDIPSLTLSGEIKVKRQFNPELKINQLTKEKDLFSWDKYSILTVLNIYCSKLDVLDAVSFESDTEINFIPYAEATINEVDFVIRGCQYNRSEIKPFGELVNKIKEEFKTKRIEISTYDLQTLLKNYTLLHKKVIE